MVVDMKNNQTQTQGNEMKLGDYVDFKRDIEGSGYIVEIHIDRSLYGSTKTYIVAMTPDKSITNEPRWHSEARYSDKHNDYVVYVDEDHIWEID